MTEGMNREGLLTLYQYNAYATRHMLDTVEKLDIQQLTEEISPSHGTVRRLLQHMIRTETYYLAVCQGHALDFDPTRYNTLEEIRAYWDGLEHRMQRYIATTEEEELQEPREFRIRDRTFALPAWKLLLQAFVHSTHHRGEIGILLSQLGSSPPNLDIILHFIEESGQSLR